MMKLFKPTKGKVVVTILVIITMFLTFYQLGTISQTLFGIEFTSLDYILFGVDIAIMIILTYIFTSIGFHFMKIKW